MRRTLTVVTPDGTGHDIELTAPESTTMRQLAEQFFLAWGASGPRNGSTGTGLAGHPSRDDLPSPAPMLYIADSPLPGGMALGESPLRDGVRVGSGTSLPDEPVTRDATLWVVAGEGAGEVARFPDRAVNDPRFGEGVLARSQVEDLLPVSSATGIWLRPDAPPEDAGDFWHIGGPSPTDARCLRWRSREPAEPDQLPPGDGGTLLFTRPPRRRPRPALTVPDLPATDRWWHTPATRDQRARKVRESWRALRVTQLAAGMPLAWSGPPLAGALRAADLVAYDIAALLDFSFPDAAAVRDFAVLRSHRLWERRRTDPDFLALRCGLRTAVPTDGGVMDLWNYAFPAVVSLPQRGVIGVVGAGDRPRRLAGWLALQTAVHHSPEDVVVRVLTDTAGAADWRWLRWLPRSSSALDDADAPRVHADPTSVAQQIGALLLLLSDRQSAADAARAAAEQAALLDDLPRQGAPQPLFGTPAAAGPKAAESGGYHGPAVVLILDGIRRLRAVPGVARLLQEGPAAGIYAVCLGTEARQLPYGYGCLVDISVDGGGPRIDFGRPYPFVPDLPRTPWFETPARALAPLRNADAVQRALDLADRPLPELLGLESPADPGPIAARWSAVPRSTTAVVGQADGSPFELDLRRHGPHALVAGAGDSGRTAFLRGWITSLAIANRPDEMIFVLVDYKGGTAFGSVAALPHVTSLIADLDGRQAERMLDRLQAELRSREAHLGAHGARDIDDYHDLRDRRRELPPLPRLVLVIAEFAGLARELPIVVAGLLNLAQSGRSLGVHLVLATQRPGGSLTSDIQSITNLRIALRVAGADESASVIDAPDAAAISRSSPGRAFLRTGAEELREFQAALPVVVGSGHRPDPVIAIRDLDPAGLLPPAVTTGPSPSGGAAPATDLDLLVSAVRTAARRLGVRPLPGPLPEPLPRVVTLSELPAPEGDPRDPAPVAYGVQELADEVGRQPALFDLAADGPLAAAGAPRSGRSQFLRTLAAALAVRHSTADVHLFCIDCGNGALQVLSRLPHCGAVVNRGRPDHMARLTSRLTAALYRRQQLFAESGFSDIAAQRQAVPEGRRLPYLVLLLDRWETFAEFADRDYGRMRDDLALLMSEGARAGIQVVLAGEADAFFTELRAPVADLLVLDQRDRQAYEALGVETPRGHLEPGRALRAFSPVELQIALLDGEPTGRGQSDALDRLAARLRERDEHVPQPRRPFTIDDAPRAAEKFHVGSGRGRPVGREDVLAWLRDRHATGASVALLGPRRAGKTWVLEELSRRLAAEGSRREIHRLLVPPLKDAVDSPDALAALLDRGMRQAGSPAEALLDKAAGTAGGSRLVFLLDEVGRLAGYSPAAVSWLRDLGQAGAWLLYTGSEKDWRTVVRRALTVPGSSFGNDVNARLLGPLDREAALDFLSGTAANLGVALARDTAAADIVRTVGSWPFYLQVAGDAVVSAVQGNDLRALSDSGALRELLDRRLLTEWSSYFQSRWAEIGPAGRAALLTAPGTVPRDATPAQREDLREVGLLRPGEEWLDDPPLLDWIARNEIQLRDGELPA
ncbi:FtsK/SpoIIIE domain-containing protein [Streptomyces sp. NBC_01477]|uniref:FtsK/SpoIIIE domain-containing protein n=1 Tax=Streptomyces sp. NBC_01477 TaxID=2976015 RepID=UPI002E2F7F6C|nr:FtsK/SpoIIIE domain-containing protein [Streptomyces sp. NBC_01477]